MKDGLVRQGHRKKKSRRCREKKGLKETFLENRNYLMDNLVWVFNHFLGNEISHMAGKQTGCYKLKGPDL